jgi:protein-L-isoaspartate(D-aspartate) O-methyltransferase
VAAPTWIDRQLLARGVRDERVIAAMAAVARELFVPEEHRAAAYEDGPIPLPHGQTISQPYMVAVTCEALALSGDERVLDIGTGSGYAAAVLAELAGCVYTIERIPELADAARLALAAGGYERVSVHVGDGSLGLPEYAPYDAIAVAAAAAKLPAALWQQLREGGRIAVPLRSGRGRQHLCVLERTPAGPRLLAAVPARFVPLVPGHPVTNERRDPC